MSTRKSARLSAASDLKSSSSPAAQAMAPPPPPPPAPRGRKRKADAKATAEDGEDADGIITETTTAAPTTPNKRRAPKSQGLPPATPTPSNASLFGERGSTTPITKLKPKPAAVSRLADPNATNATLLSPESSQVVTSSRAATATSPSKQPQQQQKPSATTATILEEANRHLISVDDRMRPLVERNHCRVFSPEGLAEKVDPFESLCSGIISQQVSGAAAKAIKKRFVALFNPPAPDPDPDSNAAADDADSSAQTSHKFPHPSQVAACTIEHLRTAGLSQRKAEYVQGLAQKFVSGELTTQLLADAPYDEVVERLTAVRGLGRWSVEMFACFGLKRMDVFSLGDLGVQRGMAAFEGRDVAKLKSKGGGKFKYMSEREMQEIADRFKPYRSLFMWYMWRVEETDVSTME